MNWSVYEFLNQRSEGIIAQWIRKERIQKRFIGFLNQKVDLLKRLGPDLPPQLLASLGGQIYKLKVRGKVQLRPILCDGPINNGTEYTFLVGCIERGDENDPINAVEIAQENRKIILSDNARRRRHDGDF